MSRRDIAVILERLSLDHRTSLADKACAYLQVIESNSTIKNHPSHAAVCVEIAADQLSIEVSRPALVRFSGATSPTEYSSAFQILSRILTGKSEQISRSSISDSSSLGQHNIAADTNQSHMKLLLGQTCQVYLRQLSIQRGSLELVNVVLECLGHFFEVWVKSLTPAQRVHVKYSDPKWVGSAFWLCAMAREMTAGKDEAQASEAGTGSGTRNSKSAIKRIGGRGGKELKDKILEVLEHTVKKSELESTIRLIEQTIHDYLMGLRKSRQKDRALSASSVANSTLATSKKQKTSIKSDNDGTLAEDVASMQGNVELRNQEDSSSKDSGFDGDPLPERASNSSAPTSVPVLAVTTSRGRRCTQALDVYAGLGTKRQISNVSQMSLMSDDENEDSELSSLSTSKMQSSIPAKPPAKRKKADIENDTPLLSSGIMAPTRGMVRKGLKETTIASQDASRTQKQRQRVGGIYSMIPRIKYVDSKAFTQYQEWRTRILKLLHSQER
ncbi:hypothetical protein BX616_000207 [Lobosporangium transversale]|uniref:ORC6 first cyclin-like domain-containing protein n=1 Tax=Lobosporangium transversale TaxID=64571 RepID=A0A1Y2G986_9FUNG|nr:hypothetical protein BCR41DRAFT_425874 [Lobosporangium transversale]KAF9917689.1 hypothetical protein BX616_000207 [Lobosporangium transversale]ORZ04582.1 hypothetical protein BCR41DRAFT_425874 [Lobosporangium transversale]|eukprot:XP_021876628.1 hypothetical protein BCR41DRAFT_425874 [Lobosporangium transversale]